MISRRQWQVVALTAMSLIGVAFGVWLSLKGFTVLGCVYTGVFLWQGQRFAVWLIAPITAPSDHTPRFTSWWQRLLLAVVCLLGAAICSVGVYLWRWWPEDWQAGLVFVLFGLLILGPVTAREIQFRRKPPAHI